MEPHPLPMHGKLSRVEKQFHNCLKDSLRWIFQRKGSQKAYAKIKRS
jgi:hypothetical protein